MEDCIAKIRQARTLLAAAMAGCDTPQIEAMLKNADLELHWALWNLGEPVSLHPELERAANRGNI
jgi:hypothetical protein